MKAIININYTQAFKNTNLKGKSFKVVETVGNRITLNINGRLTDFYGNEVTILESKTIEVLISNCDTMDKAFSQTIQVRSDNKIRILGDGFGDWVFKFQTVKTTSKGDYLKMYGQRVYFACEAPTFKDAHTFKI